MIPRIRLKSQEEYDLLMNYRDRHKALVAECQEKGIPIDSVKYGWHKSEKFSLFFKNEEAIEDVKALKDEIVAEVKAHAPNYPFIKRDKVKEEHLLVVDPADPHFGKYATIQETGQASNLTKTQSRFAEGIEGLIRKTDCFTFDKIVFVGGNDVIHTDNPFSTTTSGTRQDTSGMWYEHYQAALKCYVEGIDRLLTIADVHFVFNPSNHDFMTGFHLAQTIQAWYHNNKNITFDISPNHRKYLHYGASLIGLTHGDGAKNIDLSDLMKTEAKQSWAQSLYGYWYVHHIHHKDKAAYKGNKKAVQLEKDYKGVTVLHTGLNTAAKDYCHVEALRSLSGPDRWHATQGFIHSKQAMECFVHSLNHGQIARFSHLF